MTYLFKSSTGAEREIDEKGRTVRLTAPNGFTENAEYNSNGTKKSYSVSDKYEEEYEYDENGDLYRTRASYGLETYGEIVPAVDDIGYNVYIESTDGFRMWYNEDAQIIAIHCNDIMTVFEYQNDVIVDVKAS